MIIDIPLSTELLTWWIKNAKFEDYSIEAPLPIRLDFSDGQSIDLGKAGLKLSSDFEGESGVYGHVSVSSNNEDAQVRMLGFEYVRDSVEFKLTDEEKKIISLMVETASTFVSRAIIRAERNEQIESFEDMFAKTDEE